MEMVTAAAMEETVLGRHHKRREDGLFSFDVVYYDHNTLLRALITNTLINKTQNSTCLKKPFLLPMLILPFPSWI